jgi:hypothetical protein
MANYEETVKNQENTDGKVQSEAVTAAMERIEKEKTERESYEVQRRLVTAERDINDAAREGRFASKRKNILKTFSDDLNAATDEFKNSGDYKKFDETKQKLESDKNDALTKAKREVYGDDAWRY